MVQGTKELLPISGNQRHLLTPNTFYLKIINSTIDNNDFLQFNILHQFRSIYSSVTGKDLNTGPAKNRFILITDERKHKIHLKLTIKYWLDE